MRQLLYGRYVCLVVNMYGSISYLYVNSTTIEWQAKTMNQEGFKIIQNKFNRH